jgi:hypothetical protein
VVADRSLPDAAQVALRGADHVPTWDTPVLTSLVRKHVALAERVEPAA